MGQLIRLADYRQRHAPHAGHFENPEPPDEYYCSRCGGATFKLLNNGEINCSRCRAQMNNLRVGEPARPPR